jgi:hypothetical protein
MINVSVHTKLIFAENGRILTLFLNGFCYQRICETVFAVLRAVEVFMGLILRNSHKGLSENLQDKGHLLDPDVYDNKS